MNRCNISAQTLQLNAKYNRVSCHPKPLNPPY